MADAMVIPRPRDDRQAFLAVGQAVAIAGLSRCRFSNSSDGRIFLLQRAQCRESAELKPLLEGRARDLISEVAHRVHAALVQVVEIAPHPISRRTQHIELAKRNDRETELFDLLQSHVVGIAGHHSMPDIRFPLDLRHRFLGVDAGHEGDVGAGLRIAINPLDGCV